MALDKQRILSELGNVMNQLQSADCGCMGKLFTNQGGLDTSDMANCSPTGGMCGFGGCVHGHCPSYNGYNMGYGIGYGSPGAGEPQAMNGSCMGQYNPRQVYADTYNYLNQHLIQPTVKEVYNDLKSITPKNTVMNNDMPDNMGMSSQGMNPSHTGNPMQGETRQHGHPTQRGAPFDGTMGIQQNEIMGMGNNVQGTMHGNMAMKQNPDHDGGVAYQMGETIESDGKTPQQQFLQNAITYNMQEDNMRNYVDNNKQMNQQMMNQNMAQMMGGMGPQIVNTMNAAKPISSLKANEGQMPAMPIDTSQSYYDKEHVESLNTAGEMHQGQYNLDTNNPNQQMYYPPMSAPYNMNDASMASQVIPNPLNNMSSGFNPNAQHIQNYNMPNATMQQNLTSPCGIQNNANPANQQMSMANQNYGQHTLGIKKFNEMFPGMMSEDFGFDPMAMAVQLNPANNPKSSVNTMPKMNGYGDQNSSVIAGSNVAAANFTHTNTSANQQGIPISSQQTPNAQFGSAQHQQYGSGMNNAMNLNQPNQIPKQQAYNTNQVIYEATQRPVNTAPAGTTNACQGQGHQQMLIPHQQYQQQQIVANTVVGTPQTNQLQPHQQIPNQQQQYQYNQQQIHPSAEAVIQQTNINREATENINAQMQQQQNFETNQMMIQDPILPIDTSRFQPPPNMRRPKSYNYNTLGQPVEMLPAKLFQSNPETNLPQTLYPQPVSGKLRKDIDRFNIKSTMSKTSLMGNKPVGRTPSRSQLQNIYNQYKGSQSYTQQNIRAPEQGGSYSEGKIIQRGNLNSMVPIPVERVGGDTVTNNQVNDQVPIKGQTMQNAGNVPQPNKPHGDTIPAKEAPLKLANCRNGLQDMAYTTYPTSAASWSFHGNGPQRVPFSSNTRRYRIR